MNRKTIFSALISGFLALLVVNVIYFIIALNNTELVSNWSVAFKHGTFQVNEQIVGFKFFSRKANVLVLSVFIGALLSQYINGASKSEGKSLE